jgi:hypothetical protein
VEVFSGMAGISRALSEAGSRVLPPIDIVVDGFVAHATDITDGRVTGLLMQLIKSHVIRGMHFGTPCTTYSRARRHDGGPPPLRSSQHLAGLPGLSPSDQAKVQAGNLFMNLTVELANLVHNSGGWFTIENPASSLLWQCPEIAQLQKASSAVLLTLDMCMFGAGHKKPTSFLCSSEGFAALAKRCQGNHTHEELSGMVVDPVSGKKIWKTKLAQVYPQQLCQEYAQLAAAQLAQVSAGRSAEEAHRKRPLGAPVPWQPGRQLEAALAAKAAGVQLKRGAAPPMITVETYPEQAVELVLNANHPLCCDLPMPPHLEYSLQLMEDPKLLADWRAKRLSFWHAEAERLRPFSINEINSIEDRYLRRLYSHGQEQLSSEASLGSFVHFALWRCMAASAKVQDQGYIDEMAHGFSVVGDIAKSSVWPPLERDMLLDPQRLEARAWEIRARVVAGVRSRGLEEHAMKVWEDTVDDVAAGYTAGPFFKEDEVTAFVGSSHWIPTPRFPVAQRNKVRGVDGATSSSINQASRVVEKLQLTSTDFNVALIRRLQQAAGGPVGGWVLDEAKAYRQIGVAPQHRKFAVIVLLEPQSARLAFFVMIGHSFGWVSSVYNYNRRSRLLNEILMAEFALLANFFYDDKFGFEPLPLVAQAHKIAQQVHSWLGVKFDQKKLQAGQQLEILGVGYDLQLGVLHIKDKRKVELSDEINQALRERKLSSGQAAKLKGKLMFAASQFWGRTGRAFLLALSERQYSRSERVALCRPLELALRQWLDILQEGRPRPLAAPEEKSVQSAVFTDGWAPDPRTQEQGLPRVGGVLFRAGCPTLFFSEEVPPQVLRAWLPRKTQIALVELLAVVCSLWAFTEELRGSRTVFLVDAEAVEAALVKGYSARSDMCELISVFWAAARHLDVLSYIDRVPTDANPADEPSRGNLEPALAHGWVRRRVQLTLLKRTGLGEASEALRELGAAQLAI